MMTRKYEQLNPELIQQLKTPFELWAGLEISQNHVAELLEMGRSTAQRQIYNKSPSLVYRLACTKLYELIESGQVKSI